MDTEDSAMASKTSLPLILIAAVSPSNGIGCSGGLPWRLSGEMAYFRRVTNFVPTSTDGNQSINAVLMGKNTWNSIPTKFRPLKGRINVVVSSKATDSELGISQCPDTHLFPSLSEAIQYLQSRLPSSTSNPIINPENLSSSPLPTLHRTFLIGGAQLYSQLLSSTSKDEHHHLSHLLLTRIFTPFFENCDTFIPEFRSKDQIYKELKEVTKVLREREHASDLEPLILERGLRDGDEKWEKCSEKELKNFIREKLEDGERNGINLQKEMNKEKGFEDQEVNYEFQMWVPKK